ncbi:hypothetical protein KKA95_04005 [Patescibacteria group bacterium]|nr:hypothetical protein [Patescibacteria group bacterium]
MPSTQSEIMDGFKEHLRVQFKDQKRKTKSITTGNRHRFVDTHLEEVPRLTELIINRVREICPLILTDIDPLIIEIIARGHDLLEDGYGEGCPIGCQQKPTCSEHYVRMSEDTRKKLIELGLGKYEAEYCVDRIRALSKDFSLSKPERNPELYTRLRNEPFEIKCIKTADNWHNMMTLHGRGFEKAVKNYIRVRQSWPKIFTEEELEVLSRIDMIEHPNQMKVRTFLFTHLLAAMERGVDLPNIWLPIEGFPKALANPKRVYEDEIKRMEMRMIWCNVHDGPVHKIENICTPGVLPSIGPQIPFAAEGQIVLARMMEREKLMTLDRFREAGLRFTQMNIESQMIRDSEVCIGQSNPFYSDMGARERILMFLDSIGMSGEDLIKLDDEEEFFRIINEAMEKEREKETLAN